MSWDDLRFFLAVARAGRVSGAAKALGVEHTTVSRRLAALEAELSLALFYRTASGYRLTPEGEGLLPSAEAMERAALAFRARAGEQADVLEGQVRLALLEEFATHWLAPALPAFRAQHPKLDLQILTGIAPLDITRGDADLAIRTPRPKQPGLSAVRLGRSTTGLYASREHLGGRPLRIRGAENARGRPFLVYSPPYDALQSAAWVKPVIAASDVVLTSNSTLTLLAAARAGVGIAVLPRLVARSYPELVPLSADAVQHEVWLVTHPEYRRDPKVRAVSDFLRRVARGPDGII